MLKQAVKQAIGNNKMEAALETLGKGIARWTDKNDRFVTAIPRLTPFSDPRPWIFPRLYGLNISNIALS